METLASPGDLAHLHLLINHFPTIGTVLGVGLFLLGFLRKSDGLKKVSLEVFCLIALATLPAYLSGVAAQESLKGRPEIVQAAIDRHETAALYALLVMSLTGGFAWFGLWQWRRVPRAPQGTLLVVLALSVITLGVVSWAANIGGDIRHPEIISAAATDEVASTPGTWLTARGLGTAFVDRIWTWPTAETLHFIGMSLLFGVLLIVNLCLLGFMPNVPYSAVHRLLPWGILGIALNFITGMLFFIGAPEQYAHNVAFHWKIILLVLAGLNYLYLTVFEGPWALPPGARPRLIDKLIAGSSLLLWIGVMYFGRMLPFIGSSL